MNAFHLAGNPVLALQPSPVLCRRFRDGAFEYSGDGKPGVSKDTQKNAFQRACNSLLNQQRIASRDGFIWRPDMG